MTLCADVKEHPIPFSGEMIRAIIDGRKTQTRRVITLPSWATGRDIEIDSRGMAVVFDPQAEMHVPIRCPFTQTHRFNAETAEIEFGYQAGNRLWVRETWRETFDIDDTPVMEYRAGGTRIIDGKSVRHGEHRITSVLPKWRPSIFMPRWASRITLEVTEVRVQRLQEISEADALAEGVDDAWLVKHCVPPPRRLCFKYLWDDINAKRGYGFDVNPWVWAVSFRRCA